MTNGERETAIVKVEETAVTTPEASARTISKFAESSMQQFSVKEMEIMQRTATIEDLQIKPCKRHSDAGGDPACLVCQIHEPWVHCQRRLNEAFGSQWSITPAPWNPKVEVRGNTVYREFILWVRGEFVDSTFASKQEFRETANIGDAIESLRGLALVRLCKHKFSTNLDLWELRKRHDYRKQLADLRKGKSAKPPGDPAKHALVGAEPHLSSSVPPPTLPYPELLNAIKSEMKRRWPSQSTADVDAKRSASMRHFGVATWSEIIEMKADQLSEGLDSLRGEP